MPEATAGRCLARLKFPTSSAEGRSGASGFPLSQDQLTRISALVGVFKGLHLLFADDTADTWMRRPNTGPLFDRLTPIEAMIEGGIPRMLDVRRYVDAVRGGL